VRIDLSDERKEILKSDIKRLMLYLYKEGLYTKEELFTTFNTWVLKVYRTFRKWKIQGLLSEFLKDLFPVESDFRVRLKVGTGEKGLMIEGALLLENIAYNNIFDDDICFGDLLTEFSNKKSILDTFMYYNIDLKEYYSSIDIIVREFYGLDMSRISLLYYYTTHWR
jgi:hypothetical protein